MKRFILSVVGSLCLLGAAAANEVPVYFTENFSVGEGIPSDWIQYGVDATPSGSYAGNFSDYDSGNYFSLMNTENTTVAWSPSQFSDGSESDQWLITPEILVEDEDWLISYTVWLRGNTDKNRFKVLLSEGGTAKEDFKKSIVNTTLNGNGNTATPTERRASVYGYKGKTVRLAFVNTENKSGMVGFSDIEVGQYKLVVNDIQLVQPGTSPLSINIGLCSSTYTEGLTAVVKADNGYTSTFANTFVYGSTNLNNTEMTFPDSFSLGAYSIVGFTLELTPNFDGARTSVVRGRLVKAGYGQVVIFEEHTGTWCSNCPRGIALMNYMKDTYGFEKGGRYGGVAIHCSGNDWPDPMQPPFLNEALQVLPTTGYPDLYMNRAGHADPMRTDYKSEMAKWVGIDAKISRVDLDASGKIKVKYGVTTQYDADLNLRALIYVIENNVSGTSSGYAQANGYGGTDADYVIRNYGEEYVPYFKIFQEYKIVPADKMVYNEVGRSVAPNMKGQSVSFSTKEYVYSSADLSTTMPSNVLKKENTEIMLVIIDDATGEIIAGDAVSYEHFNTDYFPFDGQPVYPEGFDPENALIKDPTDLVNEISAASSFSFNGNLLTVRSEEAGELAVYSADGLLVASAPVAAGVSTLRLDADGLLLIRLTTPTGTRTMKVIR